MVMTAPSRLFFSNFEVLRPSRRTQSLQQKFLEMTKIECSAWNLYRPTSPTAFDKWAEMHDETGGIGKISTEYIFDQNVSNMSSASRVSDIDRLKFSHGIAVVESQNQPLARALCFEHGDTNMNRFGISRPILRDNYPKSLEGNGREVFTDCTEVADRVKECRYQPARISDSGSFAFNPHARIDEEAFAIETLAGRRSITLDRNRVPTACTSSSAESLSIDPRALVSADVLAWNEALDKNNWWPPSACHDDFELMAQDGLPQREQRPFYKDSRTAGSRTISPIVLAFESPPPAMSTSISSEDTLDFFSVSSTTCGIKENRMNSSRSEAAVNPAERTYNLVQPRVGPTAFRSSRNILPNPPRQISQMKRSNKNKSLRPNLGGNSHHRPLIFESCTSPSPAVNEHNELPPARLDMTEEDELMLLLRTGTDRADSTRSIMSYRQVPQRNAKDDFLVRSKLAGMSYKDIRRHGKFSEAESTLRGRFRTLTKHKTARVRKPEWEDNDVQLLIKAVRTLARGSEPATSRIPWKQVAEYIADNGGSYHFGNATCRKKWDELEKSSMG